MSKEVIHTAAIALAAFAACVFVQRMFPIPVVGQYLPGGSAAATA